MAGYKADPDPSTHKVSLDTYRQESLKLLDIFKQGLPLGAVEKVGLFQAPLPADVLHCYLSPQNDSSL